MQTNRVEFVEVPYAIGLLLHQNTPLLVFIVYKSEDLVDILLIQNYKSEISYRKDERMNLPLEVSRYLLA